VTRIGSLFTGTGALDNAVQQVLGGEVQWFADNDPAASKLLAYHYPHIPNLGDITTVDWAGGDAHGSLADIDVLTGGFP
jgi:DNA (cytosine-5)-methyltransferase 1